MLGVTPFVELHILALSAFSVCPQVVAILEAGQPLPFKVKAANLDLPELQGEPEEIAKEKCRLAAEQVRTTACRLVHS